MKKDIRLFVERYKTSDKVSILEILCENDTLKNYKMCELPQIQQEKAVKAGITLEKRFSSATHDKYIIYAMLYTKNISAFLRYFLVGDCKSSAKILVQLNRYLQIYSPLLQFLTLNCVNLSEKLICKLYFLIKDRHEADNPMNLQLIMLYRENVANIPLDKLGYVLGSAAKLCKSIFHTQVDKKTNLVLLKYFLTAADMASRKENPSYVSTGGYYKLPEYIANKYEDIWINAPVKNNPKKWIIPMNSSQKDFYLDISEESFLTDL